VIQAVTSAGLARGTGSYISRASTWFRRLQASTLYRSATTRMMHEMQYSRVAWTPTLWRITSAHNPTCIK